MHSLPNRPTTGEFMLGQIFGLMTATRQDVSEMRGEVREIRDRLAQGDATFAELKRQMGKRKPEVDRWERVMLESIRIGQFLLVLWLTGSIDAAVQVLTGGK